MAKQYNYNDQVPTQYYNAFAKAAGCSSGTSTTDTTVFNCLVNADTAVLQNASASVSVSGEFGTFAFLPVTDGKFIPAAPSQQLLKKAVSGRRVLVGVCSLNSIFQPIFFLTWSLEQCERRSPIDLSKHSYRERLFELCQNHLPFSYGGRQITLASNLPIPKFQH